MGNGNTLGNNTAIFEDVNRRRYPGMPKKILNVLVISCERVFQVFNHVPALTAAILIGTTTPAGVEEEKRTLLTLPTCESPEYALGVIPPEPRNPELCHPVYIIPEVTKESIRELEV